MVLDYDFAYLRTYAAVELSLIASKLSDLCNEDLSNLRRVDALQKRIRALETYIRNELTEANRVYKNLKIEVDKGSKALEMQRLKFRLAELEREVCDE